MTQEVNSFSVITVTIVDNNNKVNGLLFLSIQTGKNLKMKISPIFYSCLSHAVQ